MKDRVEKAKTFEIIDGEDELSGMDDDEGEDEGDSGVASAAGLGAAPAADGAAALGFRLAAAADPATVAVDLTGEDF